MRFEAPAILTGIATSKGEYNGKEFDSCTFHLAVDLGQKTTGETMGTVTRPFKLGTSEEFEKWRQYKDKWPVVGLPVVGLFEISAGADNTSKVNLLSIKLAPQAKA